MKQSFAPVIDQRAHTLILGSMPGDASLAAQQYYAYRHNAFWPIMRQLLRMPESASYEARLRALQAAGIALWDVLAECRREGSLDSNIDRATARANDIAGLLREQRGITLICLNGSTVQTLFRRHVLKQQELPPQVEVVTLPSTSPANARLDFSAKLQAWQAVLEPQLQAAAQRAICGRSKGRCR
jgi:TDG/mug DNA glycosylase family protein